MREGHPRLPGGLLAGLQKPRPSGLPRAAPASFTPLASALLVLVCAGPAWPYAECHSDLVTPVPMAKGVSPPWPRGPEAQRSVSESWARPLAPFLRCRQERAPSREPEVTVGLSSGCTADNPSEGPSGAEGPGASGMGACGGSRRHLHDLPFQLSSVTFFR